MKSRANRLIWNDEPNHVTEILDKLSEADRFICMVAFAKESGFKKLEQTLKEAVEGGMEARFVIGVDFYQSEPSVIEKLLKLKSLGNVNVYMGSSDRQYTFHPKLFMFETDDTASLIVGSANLTDGGLSSNHELSLTAEVDLDDVSDDIDGWIDNLVDDGEIVEATPAIVAEYARRHAIYTRRMFIAHKRAERAAEEPDGGLGTLAEILSEMKADKSEWGFDQSVARRLASNIEGQEILMGLGDARGLSSDEFLAEYNRLLDTFHSSGLRRANTTVTGDRAAFLSGVRAIISFRDADPSAMFEHLKDHFVSVNRAGTNLLTEILQLFDKRKYAVMNQNSVSGMRLAGITDFPIKPTKQNVSGEMYGEFCRQADNVRADLGLDDFSQLDALFNYAYWRDA